MIIKESNIRLWDYNGKNAQLWKMKENKEGSFAFLSHREDLAITKDSEGNVYPDKLTAENEAQKWWMEYRRIDYT